MASGAEPRDERALSGAGDSQAQTLLAPLAGATPPAGSAAPPASGEIEPQTRLGDRFEIGARLGRGGAGSEMLAGAPPLGPLGPPSPAALVRHILDDVPTPPAQAPAALAAPARAALWAVLGRGLAKDPADRPESSEALMAALLAAAGPLPPVERARPGAADAGLERPTPRRARRAQRTRRAAWAPWAPSAQRARRVRRVWAWRAPRARRVRRVPRAPWAQGVRRAPLARRVSSVRRAMPLPARPRPLSVRAGVEALVDLASHLEGAERPDEATQVWQRAGELATAQAARDEAWRCLARAHALTPHGDTELLTHVGEAALEAGAFGEAERVLTMALARLPEASVARAEVLASLAGVARQLARWDEVLARCSEGLAALGEPSRHAALGARLHGLRGWVLGYIRGDNTAGLPESLRAVELLEHRGLPLDLAAALSRLGANYMRLGRFRDQLACNRRNLALAEAAGAIDLVARAHLNLGVNLDALGELDEALAHERTALELYNTMCAPASVALAHNNLAVILTNLGRLDDADRALATALAMADRLGAGYFRIGAEATRARLWVKRGDLAAAREAAEAAAARGAAEAARVDEALARRILGAVLARLGDHAGAEAALAQAQSLAAGADLAEEARVFAERARAAWRAGAPARAQALRAEAEARLTRLGTRLDLAHIDDLGWI